jgi:hypothetical protein
MHYTCHDITALGKFSLAKVKSMVKFTKLRKTGPRGYIDLALFRLSS